MLFQQNITLGGDEGGDGYLGGQLLIAMPGMQDPRFQKAVLYICVHTADGAMGLVLNRLIQGTTLAGLLKQLEIPIPETVPTVPVHYGGPVESGRGFVLHTAEYHREHSINITAEASLTATVDILQDIAAGTGPAHYMLALGYAGWAPGQLDAELQHNGWLTVAPDTELLFGTDTASRWEKAIAKIGIRLDALSGDAGHA